MNNKVNSKEEFDIDTPVFNQDYLSEIRKKRAEGFSRGELAFDADGLIDVASLKGNIKGNIKDDDSDSWDDLDFDELDDLPGDEPQIKQPVIEESKPEIINNTDSLNLTPIQGLLTLLKGIYSRVDAGSYSDDDKNVFWSVNVELTNRNIEPFRRARGLKFDGVACRNDVTGSISPYMLDWQVVDLYYIWKHHHGRSTFESFAGIFQGDDFNKSLAEKIASKKMAVKSKNLEKSKIGPNALDLPKSIQNKLAALRQDASRKKQDESIYKESRLNNQRLDIRDELKRSGGRQMTDDVIDKLVNVWMALKLSQGSISGAMSEYARITETEEPSRDFIKNRQKKLASFGFL